MGERKIINKTTKYILGELKTIEKECREKGISASEWVERYAGEYHRRYWNGSMRNGRMLKRGR